MFDKNGNEIKVGDVVKIEGAYFKKNIGEFIVTKVPGSPNWNGKDCCLTKATKKHQFSKQKYNLCFWPLIAFTNDYIKAKEAKAHNKKYATIEVIGNVPLGYVEQYEKEVWGQ